MKKMIALILIALMSLAGVTALAEGQMAEGANSDWYMAVLADEALISEYPYHAFVDVNGNGVPVLIVSTTEDSFITDEDHAIVYLYDHGAPKQVMEAGGQGGEIFYANLDEHTLTHFSRLSGEGHYEVFSVADSALELLTKIDYYAANHGPIASDKTLYYQDGEEITENAANELINLYAGDNAVTYTALEGNDSVGTSDLYTVSDMDEAIALINAEFSTWTGCEMHSLRYAGDECATAENLAWMNELGEKEYTQVIEFLSDFHSPVEGGSAWEPDTEYKDWQWWLARTEDGNWELLTWGY